MKKPLIGITAPPGKLEDLLKKSYMQAYIAAIETAGGIPRLLPLALLDTPTEEIMQDVDGLLLSGGGDVDPDRFGGSTHPTLEHVSRERDELEIRLFQHAIQKDVPIFGICRGCQMINVALGGTLYTDLPEQLGLAINHSTPDSFPKDHLMHTVCLQPEFFISRQTRRPSFRVNSRHHQGIHVLADTLEVMAFSPDGLVEAVRIKDHGFGYAVQWHPENLVNDSRAKELFSAFVRSSAGLTTA
jgi:putative glutamine amidotransferase